MKSLFVRLIIAALVDTKLKIKKVSTRLVPPYTLKYANEDEMKSWNVAYVVTT